MGALRPLPSRGLALLGGLLWLLASLVPVAAQQNKERSPVLRASLSNGLRLLTRHNDSSEIVAITCLIQVGLPDEKPSQAGLAALTAEALLQGTTVHKGPSFAAQVARIARSVTSSPDADFTEITMVTRRDRFEPALKLLAELLSRPEFSEKGIAAARANLGARRRLADQSFTSASFQALADNLYPRSPYGRPILGYPRTLARLTAADVRAFWQRNYVQNRMVLAIVGDVGARRAMRLAQKGFASLPFKPGARTPRPRIEPLLAPRLEIIQRGETAGQVLAGFLAPGVTPENYPVYAVMEAIIGGGKGARMFRNIREKKGMGYELGSFYQPLRYQSYLGGYVLTPVVRRSLETGLEEGIVDSVKQALLAEFRGLTVDGPTDQELARAKAYVIGRTLLRQERNRDQARWLAWSHALGLGVERSRDLSQKVNAVTKEQISAAAKSSLRNYALVVTMPKAPMNTRR